VKFGDFTVAVGSSRDPFSEDKERDLSYIEKAEKMALSNPLSDIEIGGKEAVYVEMQKKDLPVPNPTPYIFAATSKDGKVYEFYFEVKDSHPDAFKNSRKLFMEMLSSFEFLD